ncbi:general transcription factor IIH subunit 2-like [Polyodon spathula]|uniref:general transcription factor IIH subunit 2-like n=1 Tax=Polyodon spathula TaxID=7913 RepID=UPI001B7DC744|nr:general transcription factor IIH subunit 2-like [Polyodon spathula]XP_041094300.1 general transcription factor IIH subunit 2-like [Polyodon spathula]
MGFPQHTVASTCDQDSLPSFSMAHLDSSGSGPSLTLGGYYCPQCRAKCTELPVECKVCDSEMQTGVSVASRLDVAVVVCGNCRSYIGVCLSPGALLPSPFPIRAFTETPLQDYQRQKFCQGCQGELKDQNVYMCMSCQSVFCVECDLFIHESLHCCPSCIHSQPSPPGV